MQGITCPFCLLICRFVTVTWLSFYQSLVHVITGELIYTGFTLTFFNHISLQPVLTLANATKGCS